MHFISTFYYYETHQNQNFPGSRPAVEHKSVTEP